MKRLAWIRTVSLMVILAAVMAACDTGQPPPITVVVPITAVQNQEAVDNAVNATMTSIAALNFAQTATVVAQGGVTYTPSATFTPSITPTPTPTRFITRTPTPRPTETPTATFPPLQSNTPQPAAQADTAWIRVLHGYSDLGQVENDGAPFDIFINDQRVQRALSQGEETNYLQVVPGTVRLTLRMVDDYLNVVPAAPIISQTIEVPTGSTTAVIIRNELVREGLVRLGLLPIREDVSPLGTGRSRLTIVHSNPDLLPVGAILSDRKQALAYDFTVGDVVGPLDMEAGEYIIDLFDNELTDQYIASLPAIELNSYRNYILLLTPYRGDEVRITDTWLFSGNTRLNRDESYVRFINAAANIGQIGVSINRQLIVPSLRLGQISDPVPVSAAGNIMEMTNLAGADLGVSCEGEALGPWETESIRQSDKLILLTNITGEGDAVMLCTTILAQNPTRSAINANVRLINMLPNTVPLVLQVRPIRQEIVQNAEGVASVQEIGEDRNPWVTLTDTAVRLGSASEYIARVPEIYSIRIVPSGTANTLVGFDRVQFAAGGVYDLLVLPGEDAGSATLLLVEPQVQVTNLAINEGDPAAISEAVQATLTAAAPRVTSTPTPATTPTATPTPVLTNTPRPTNTPDVLPPAITANILPPDQVLTGVFTLNGVNFAPTRRFSVVLVSTGDEIAAGTVEPNGVFSVEVTLPPETLPGPQGLSVTVTRPDGLRQVAYTLILVAEAQLTPSPTP